MNPDRKLFIVCKLPRIAATAVIASGCAFSEAKPSNPDSSESAISPHPTIYVTIYPTVSRDILYNTDANHIDDNTSVALSSVEHATPTPIPQESENSGLLVFPETLFGNEEILGKHIFITIDDCNDPEILRIMFETLKRHGATATFFPNIPSIITEETRALWREIYEAGNEIGYHTTNHDFGSGSPTSNWSVEQLEEDFDRFTNIMRDMLGKSSYTPKFVRAPYGNWNQAWMKFAKKRRVTNVSWNYVPNEQYGIFYFESVMRHPQGGKIILLHTRLWDAQWLEINIARLHSLAEKDGGALLSFRRLANN